MQTRYFHANKNPVHLDGCSHLFPPPQAGEIYYDPFLLEGSFMQTRYFHANKNPVHLDGVSYCN